MLIGSTIGPFTVEKELGSGAMGTVYLAQFHKDGERVVPVALKVVSLGLLGNEGAMARFDRESKILQQLRHPNIVRLIATGRYRQTPFIAMEYIDGEALDTVLTRRGRFSWEEVVTYGKQLCEALQYAHEKGIIHRDLKPSNLMLTKDGVLKLTDFGIAKDADMTALTGANSTIGTAAYMSPEQCKGDKNLTNKSDLYSLGVVFFEFLTGRKPFTADSTVDMFLKHVNEKPPRLGKLVPDLPGKLEALILQLIEKDKADRPVDAAWVARLLNEVEEDAFARKSAGLDVAQARRGDRPDVAEKGIDRADREAARALRGKKKKGKKETAAEPWHKRPPAKAAAILGVLLGIAALLYFAFKPARQSDLYAAVTNAPNEDARLEAVDKYLAAYGHNTDEETQRVRQLAREAHVKKREEVLTKRFARGMQKPEETDDPNAYDVAWQAMAAEKTGDLKRAADLWETLRKKFPDADAQHEPLAVAQREKVMWAWIAVKRVGDIKAAEEKTTKIPALLRQHRVNEYWPAFSPLDPEGEAMFAFRLELFHDDSKARAKWDQLAAQTEKNLDQHVWFLLATVRKRSLSDFKEDIAIHNRIVLVTKALAEARQAAETARTGQNPPAVKFREARNHCRDIIDLYDGDPVGTLPTLVAEAKKFLKSIPSR